MRALPCGQPGYHRQLSFLSPAFQILSSLLPHSLSGSGCTNTLLQFLSPPQFVFLLPFPGTSQWPRAGAPGALSPNYDGGLHSLVSFLRVWVCPCGSILGVGRGLWTDSGCMWIGTEMPIPGAGEGAHGGWLSMSTVAMFHVTLKLSPIRAISSHVTSGIYIRT